MALTLRERFAIYGKLIRLDRPIGIYLLLWPTLWALWLAGNGRPSIKNLLIFGLGVVLMRSAGCAINDFADRNFDAHVARTQLRPLAQKLIQPWEALAVAGALTLIAFILVLFTNLYTILLSFAAAALAATYPFMKRYTHLPQAVLGAAFSWSIPMAFAAEQNSIPGYSWLLYIASVLWTVAYDTQYAMCDREDDLKIGVKSTAILFGKFDLLIIALLQIVFLVLLYWLGQLILAGWTYWIGLLLSAGLFVYQLWITRAREPQRCLQAFLNNHWVGMLIFVGLFLQLSI